MPPKKLKSALNNLLSVQKEKQKKNEKQKRAQQWEQERRKKQSQQQTQQQKSPYEFNDKILLVGEGNFSFARSLVESVVHGGDNIIATCYDSQEVLHEKYEDESKGNVQVIQELGGTVLFEVDATHLDKCKAIKQQKFSKIVFNFPHAGTSFKADIPHCLSAHMTFCNTWILFFLGAGIKDQDRNIQSNQVLLKEFFKSAAKLLQSRVEGDENDGEIHVTLKSGQPYDLWSVRTMAKSTDLLRPKTAFPFVPALYPGYAHRRTLGFKEGLSKTGNEEIIDKKPKTYVFVRSQVMQDDIDKSKEGMAKKRSVMRDMQGPNKKKSRTSSHPESDDD
jgi:25S rRNA (uracil2634-N3)-methyltransferase